jgi:hypothetical protein
MRAAEFDEHFERAFVAVSRSAGLRRLKSTQPKWKIAISDGVVTCKFSTNAKSAGLLPLRWMGEFRPTFAWRHDTVKGKVNDAVSFFQHTDRAKVEEAVELQRVVLDKYLRNRRAGPAERTGWVEGYGVLEEPTPNVDRWLHYFDGADAESWGTYFGGFMGVWLRQFNKRPESLYDWRGRVLGKSHEKDEA